MHQKSLRSLLQRLNRLRLPPHHVRCHGCHVKTDLTNLRITTSQQESRPVDVSSGPVPIAQKAASPSTTPSTSGTAVSPAARLCRACSVASCGWDCSLHHYFVVLCRLCLCLDRVRISLLCWGGRGLLFVCAPWCGVCGQPCSRVLLRTLTNARFDWHSNFREGKDASRSRFVIQMSVQW